MSADNFLISLPAAGNTIALYEVSASDAHIDTNQPIHTYASYVAREYRNSLIGTYSDGDALLEAVDNCLAEGHIEYGFVARHQ